LLGGLEPSKVSVEAGRGARGATSTLLEIACQAPAPAAARLLLEFCQGPATYGAMEAIVGGNHELVVLTWDRLDILTRSADLSDPSWPLRSNSTGRSCSAGLFVARRRAGCRRWRCGRWSLGVRPRWFNLWSLGGIHHEPIGTLRRR
jgi:hypothetical protein